MDCYKDLVNTFIEYCSCCFSDDPKEPPNTSYYSSYQNAQTHEDITPNKIIYSNLTEEFRLLHTH